MLLIYWNLPQGLCAFFVAARNRPLCKPAGRAVARVSRKRSCISCSMAASQTGETAYSSSGDQARVRVFLVVQILFYRASHSFSGG